jgi:hypothetical protein
MLAWEPGIDQRHCEDLYMLGDNLREGIYVIYVGMFIRVNMCARGHFVLEDKRRLQVVFTW